MNANSLMPKELLSGADVHDSHGKPIYLNATISGLKQIEVGQDKERRWALLFKGTDRKLTLNVTNKDRLVKMFSAETDDWIGQKIALHGATATFGGKEVLAIRIEDAEVGAPELAATRFDPDDVEIPT
jgi:hypothetical protein